MRYLHSALLSCGFCYAQFQIWNNSNVIVASERRKYAHLFDDPQLSRCPEADRGSVQCGSNQRSDLSERSGAVPCSKVTCENEGGIANGQYFAEQFAPGRHLRPRLNGT